MISHTTKKFREAFKELPADIRKKARKSFKIWQSDPYRKSLRFKKIHLKRPVYSIRIDIDYHAVGVMEEETITWFWIGSHSDYEKLIS